MRFPVKASVTRSHFDISAHRNCNNKKGYEPRRREVAFVLPEDIEIINVPTIIAALGATPLLITRRRRKQNEHPRRI